MRTAANRKSETADLPSGRALFIFQVSSSRLYDLSQGRGKTASQLNLQAVFSDRGLCELSLYRRKFLAPLCQGLDQLRGPEQAAASFERLKQRLMARLNGGRAQMPWRDFDLRGRPAFHVRVWKAMHALPFGRTATYAELARAAGAPRAARAVGRACAANPVLIFIPCHRVVGSSGLGGFGCGLEWKKLLLALEGVDWRKL
jgi:O-6-methylguanine DNA methyltransferase